MSSKYRSVYPLSQNESYGQNESIDFILNLEGEKLVPGSVCLEGEMACTKNDPAAPIAGGDDINFDHVTGAHALIRDITTEFELLGIVENMNNYPRYVKMQSLATVASDSLGCETNNGVELRSGSERTSTGILQGDHFSNHTPFSLKLNCAVNKSSAPIAANATGSIRLRIRTAPYSEFFYGSDVDANVKYTLQGNLKLRYQTIPDDGERSELMIETIHSYRTNIDSNNQNISTFVPTKVDAFSMSFIPQADEQNQQANYLRCAPPPGKSRYADANQPLTHNGLEKIYFAVNDNDTALFGFTLEDKREILLNALRAFKASPDRFCTLDRMIRNDGLNDGYIAGAPLGGLIDFSRVKFAAELQSQCGTGSVHNCYIYFRGLTEVVA